MQLIMQAGDQIPPSGRLVIELKDARKHVMADGRTVFDLDGCNALAEPRPVDPGVEVFSAIAHDGSIIKTREP